jgi:3-oxoacyl-[acyl-carrier-protein] synthase-1
MGCATALGEHPAQVAAAVRARMSRPAPVEALSLLDDATQEPVPLMGHPVDGLPEGFGVLGRRAALARAAVLSLLERAPDALGPRTHVVFALTKPTEDVWLEDPAKVIPTLGEQLGRVALGLGYSPGRTEVVLHGHAGAAFALLRAARALDTAADRALVVAVDSRLDETTLEVLSDDDRLKTPDNPVGFAPGEAAVALLVERGDGGLAEVRAVSTQTAPDVADELRTGRALSEVVRATLDQLAVQTYAGDVIHDHNGEATRATQWGMVTVRLSQRLRPRAVFPAISLGDVGAASGALGVMLAVQGFARQSAAGELTLVTSSGDDGDVGCIAVGRAR